jgi:hypothetical protein
MVIQPTALLPRFDNGWASTDALAEAAIVHFEQIGAA